MNYTFIPPVKGGHRVSFVPFDYRDRLWHADSFTPNALQALDTIAPNGYEVTPVYSSDDFQPVIARIEVLFETGEQALAFMQWADS